MNGCLRNQLIGRRALFISTVLCYSVSYFGVFANMPITTLVILAFFSAECFSTKYYRGSAIVYISLIVIIIFHLYWIHYSWSMMLIWIWATASVIPSVPFLLNLILPFVYALIVIIRLRNHIKESEKSQYDLLN